MITVFINAHLSADNLHKAFCNFLCGGIAKTYSAELCPLQNLLVWLKEYGILPDYYITKQEAIEKYGWNSRRNTVAGKAPAK